MKTFSKIGAIALLAVTALMAPVFQGCKQETFDINTNLPNGSQSINIPGVDLTTIEALLTEMKNLINTNQETQLQALVDAIAGENTALSGKLSDVVAELRANATADATQYAAVMAELQKIFQAITALQDNLCQKLTAVADAINSNSVSSTATIKAAIEAAQAAINKANADNQKDLLIALSSEFLTLSKDLTSAVSKLDGDLVAKLDAILAKANDIYASGKVTETELRNITEDVDDLLEAMISLLSKIDTLNKNLCDKIEAAVAQIKTFNGENTDAITEAIAAARAEIIKATDAQLVSLVEAIAKGDNQIMETITGAVTSINNGNLNAQLVALNTLLASVQEDIQANGETTSEKLGAVKDQLDTIFGEITKVISAINEMSTDLQAKIDEATTKVINNDNTNNADVIAAVLKAQNAVTDASNQVIIKMIEGNNDIINNITAAVNSLNNGALSQSLTQLVNLVSDVKADLASGNATTSEKIEKVSEQLTSILAQMAEVLKSIDALKEAVIAKIGEAVTSIDAAISSVNEKNLANINNAINAVGEAKDAINTSSTEVIAQIVAELKSSTGTLTGEIQTAVTNLNNGNLSQQLSDILTKIGTANELTVDQLKEVRAQLKDMFTEMGTILTAIQTFETNVKTAITEAAQKVVDFDGVNSGNVIEAINKASEVVSTSSTNVIEQLANELKNSDSEIKSAINAAATAINSGDLFNKVTALYALVEKDDDITDLYLEAIQAKLGEIFGAINDAIDAIGTLKTALLGAMDAVKEAVISAEGKISSSVKDNLEKAYEEINDATAEQFGLLLAALDDDNDDVLDAIEAAAVKLDAAVNSGDLYKMFSTLKTKIESQIDHENDEISEIQTALADLLKAMQKVSEDIETLSTTLTNSISQAAQAITGADYLNTQSVISAIDQAVEDLNNADKEGISTLISALENQTSSLRESLDEACGKDSELQKKLSDLILYAKDLNEKSDLTNKELDSIRTKMKDILNGMEEVVREMRNMRFALDRVVKHIDLAAAAIIADADSNTTVITAAIDSARINLAAALDEELAALTDTLSTLNNETIESIKNAARSINSNTNRQFTKLWEEIDGLDKVLSDIEKNGVTTNQQLQEVQFELGDVLSELKKAVEYLSDIKQLQVSILDKIDWAVDVIKTTIDWNTDDVIDAISDARQALESATFESCLHICEAIHDGDWAIIGSINELIELVGNCNDSLQVRLGEIETFLEGIEDYEALTAVEIAVFQSNLSDLLREIAELIVRPDMGNTTVVEASKVSFLVPPMPPKAEATLTTSSNVTWGWDGSDHALFAYNTVPMPTDSSEVYPLSEVQALYDAVENNLQTVVTTKAEEESADKTAEVIRAKANLNAFIGTLNTQWTNDSTHFFCLRTNVPENAAVNSVVLSYTSNVNYVPVVVYTKVGTTTYYVTGYKAKFESFASDPSYEINYYEDATGHGTGHSTSHSTSHGYSGHNCANNAGELGHAGWEASSSQVGGGFTTK